MRVFARVILQHSDDVYFSMGAHMCVCVRMQACFVCAVCGLEEGNQNIYGVVMSAVAPVLKKIRDMLHCGCASLFAPRLR